MRRYEFVEGTSKKFWQIELEGESFTTRWGRIGTDGQEKSQDFDSAADARKAHDKLIAEKEKKGYQLVGGDDPHARPLTQKAVSNPELEAAIAGNRDDNHAWQVYADWLIQHGETWGENIAAVSAGQSRATQQTEVQVALLAGAEAKLEWKRGVIEQITLEPSEPDKENPMDAVLDRLLRHPAGRLLRKLSLGLPPNADGDTGWHMEAPIKVMAAAGPLPLLEELDMSLPSEHMDQVSWRWLGDVRGVWKAAPRLQTLLLLGSSSTNGGTAVKLAPIEAPLLKKLVFESSGLDIVAPEEIGASVLPKLEHLELYLGREEYGCSSTVKSLAGILAGKGLPKLTYLGLKNSEWEAQLIEAVANSEILKRLKIVDFSMGMMFDDAATALDQHAEKFRHLDRLILDDNFFTDEHIAKLQSILPNADFGTQKTADGDDNYRYTTIAE